MNRLQKKCIIGTVGIHLLLLLILIVGPAFFNREPKVDNTQTLDMIPANLVDAAVSSGVKNAQPPPPTPVQPPSPPPPVQQYTPPSPRAVQPVTPPPVPAPTPEPTFLQKVERYIEPRPTPSVTPDMTPVEKSVKHQDDNIKIDLHKVTRTAQRTSSQTDNSANARELNRELRTLKSSLSSSTKIDMPGISSASSASYIAAIQSIYNRALRPNVPEQVANGSESTIVRVTIANDGTVISSEIISPSGDPAWDNAVQRTLDQVTFVAPFPEGATEKERPYKLGFSPDVERSLE